jgi:putative heme-binding domain-containing protein
VHEDPASAVRAGALGLLQLAGPGDDAAWRAAMQRATTLAGQATDAERRAGAIALAALEHPERRVEWFTRFVSPHEPEAVQLAAVKALGRIGRDAPAASEAIGRIHLARWAALTPEGPSQAADVLIDDPARARLLVEALAKGAVQPWSLGFWQKQDLVLYKDPAIRDAARAVLEENPQQRVETVRRFAAALDLTGDAARGQAVFARACAACHRLGETPGGDLGPDLATVRHRPPLSLLADILVPSRSIAQHYETYVVERRGTATAAGLLGAETPTTITLRQGGGRTVVIRRSEIRTMAVSPLSTMPADLDKAISPEEMADLLTFIRRP